MLDGVTRPPAGVFLFKAACSDFCVIGISWL